MVVFDTVVVAGGASEGCCWRMDRSEAVIAVVAAVMAVVEDIAAAAAAAAAAVVAVCKESSMIPSLVVNMAELVQKDQQ